MIVMLISDAVEKERKYIVRFTKDWAARWTEEYWEMMECSSIRELEEVVEGKNHPDIICLDITMQGAIDLAAQLRLLLPLSYMILIASPDISPVTYLRPSIGADSLMLKPLSAGQIQEIMSEALQAYIQRFFKPDEKKVFVIENKSGRELVDYDHIFFFESREKRVYLNAGSVEYGFYDTLDKLEERLQDRFIRCHRSFLVNSSKISQVFLSQNRLVLQGDFEIPLSRSYKPAIKEFLAG